MTRISRIPGTRFDGFLRGLWLSLLALGVTGTSAADNPPVIGPAGTVHATLADWAKFIRLHLAGHHGDVTVGKLTLKRETFALLHRAYDGPGQPYAFGWLCAERPWAGGDGAALWHNGSNSMWYSLTWLGLEHGIAALVTTNRFSPEAAAVTDQATAALIEAFGQR